MSKYDNVIVEFIGTFVFLSVIYNLAMKGNGSVLTPFAIGLGLTVAIYMLSHAGASLHFNPAVSFMSLCRGDITIMIFGLFVLAQLFGALCAYGLHTYVVKA